VRKIAHPDAAKIFAYLVGAEDAEQDALLVLLTTRPTTMHGVAALLDYIQTNNDAGNAFLKRYREDAGDAFFGHLATAVRAIVGQVVTHA
jgi:hypothetical protein